MKRPHLWHPDDALEPTPDLVIRSGPLEEYPLDGARRDSWHWCVVNGCTERVDPWEHNTRCPEHRPT